MDFKLRPFRGDSVPPPRVPISASKLAEDYNGLDLELGAGAGLHAIRYARQNPDRYLIAIERTQAKFESFMSRLSRHEALPNLLALRDDALSVVTHSLTAQSLDRVFILYPNPYPKESQANKRWHRMPFITRLHECMKPGAELTLATNEEFYALEAKEWLVGLGLFGLASEAEFTMIDVETPRLPKARTHFEKKYLKGGQTVFNLNFFRI